MSRTQLHWTPRTTLASALVLPALVLALSGCTGSLPSQVPPSGSSTDQPAGSGSEKIDPKTGPKTDPKTDQNTVVTLSLKFMPQTITVKAGTTVTWENGEAIGHTVTSGEWGDVDAKTGLRGFANPDGMFDHNLSPKGQEGDSFSFTFDEPGEYPYYCKPHLTMNAMVIVEP